MVRLHLRIKTMVKINNKCFSNNYDATKYVIYLASKGEIVKITTVRSCEDIEQHINKMI